jgi:hypothetical protein
MSFSRKTKSIFNFNKYSSMINKGEYLRMCDVFHVEHCLIYDYVRRVNRKQRMKLSNMISENKRIICLTFNVPRGTNI